MNDWHCAEVTVFKGGTSLSKHDIRRIIAIRKID